MSAKNWAFRFGIRKAIQYRGSARQTIYYKQIALNECCGTVENGRIVLSPKASFRVSSSLT